MRTKKPRGRRSKAGKRIVKAAADPAAWAKLRAGRRRLKAKKAADAKKKAAAAGALLAGILAAN